jgi:hypothetical protein
MSKKGKHGKSSGPVNTKAIPPKQVSAPKATPQSGAVQPVQSAGSASTLTGLRITLTIRSPFLFPGISAGRFGVDRVGLRNQDNRLVIPQDQIKGVLRDAMSDLGVGKQKLDDWFGLGSGDAQAWEVENFDPSRGCLLFSDLVCTDTLTRTTFSHRVKIDETSGAATEGHLMVIELPVEPEKQLNFTGEVLLVGSRRDANDILAAVNAALTVPLSIGALKSVGFGRILGTKSEPFARKTTPAKLPAATEVLWKLSVDRPYLVNARRVANNAFLGQVDIPGAALKGALAQTLKAQGHDITAVEISEYLTRMTIGAARPAKAKPAMARSIVYDKGAGRFVNLALPRAELTDPILPLDWKDPEKDRAKAAGFLDQSTFEIDERVHTKINPKTGGAEDEMLVSTIAVYPKALTDKTNLVARLVLPADLAMPDPIKAALESCILPLGRTNAIVTTEGLTADSRKTTPAPGRIAIRLVSDGLLADPYEDAGSEAAPASASAAYKAFWKTVLPASELTDHFASQTMIGGYQARRFSPTGAYRPWFLTEAGSVFLFDLAPEDAPELDRLLTEGLCRPSLGGTDLTWRNCPFVAENGYGAIALYAPEEKDPSTW